MNGRMNPLLQSEIDNNLVSFERWDAFANHRRNVTGLLAGGPPAKPSRLCILGAGNCNDLDLAALVAAHRQIHLVDIDDAALARGVARQGLAIHSALHLHAGIDVSGLLDDMAAWSPPTTIGPAELEACVERPVRSVVLPGPFDVVASTCLLSQLMGGVVHTVGSAHPRFVESLQAVRTGHLRLLAHLIAPGGSGVLITDVLSSDTVPTLGSLPEERIAHGDHAIDPRAQFLSRRQPAMC